MLPHPHNPDNSLIGRAVTAIARTRRADLPRIFTLEYDNSKLKTRNAFNRAQFQKQRLLYGVVWPATDHYPAGGISLSNSTSYRDLTECKEHFAQAGKAILFWLDTEDVEEIG